METQQKLSPVQRFIAFFALATATGWEKLSLVGGPFAFLANREEANAMLFFFLGVDLSGVGVFPLDHTRLGPMSEKAQAQLEEVMNQIDREQLAAYEAHLRALFAAQDTTPGVDDDGVPDIGHPRS